MDITGFLQRTRKRFLPDIAKETKLTVWQGVSASDAVQGERERVAILGRRAYAVFEAAGKAFFALDVKAARALIKCEEQLSGEVVRLAAELGELRSLSLTSKELRQMGQMILVTAYIRRVGVYARDIAVSTGELMGQPLSNAGKQELQAFFMTALQLLDKALSVYENRSFDQLRSLQTLDEEAEEQENALMDGYFSRLTDECCEPGIVFQSVAADCARCCELACEIACTITGREKL